MFFLLKLIIWLAGISVLASFVLPFFGYAINWDYSRERTSACQETWRACRADSIQHGIEGAKATCTLQCLDVKQLIRKK